MRHHTSEEQAERDSSRFSFGTDIGAALKESIAAARKRK